LNQSGLNFSGLLILFILIFAPKVITQMFIQSKLLRSPPNTDTGHSIGKLSTASDGIRFLYRSKKESLFS
jgi:hypothetical protein